MNSMYSFSYVLHNKERHHTFSAASYKNAVEKGCIMLEELDDNLDLIGLTSWSDVQYKCADYKVSDLIELEDE